MVWDGERSANGGNGRRRPAKTVVSPVFFSWGGTKSWREPIVGMWRRGEAAYLVGDGLEDLVGADLGVGDSLGGDRALDRELGRGATTAGGGARSIVSTGGSVREGKEMFRPRRDHALGAGIRRADARESPGTCTAKVPTNSSRRVRRVHTLAALVRARKRNAKRSANLLNIAERNDAGRKSLVAHLGLLSLIHI